MPLFRTHHILFVVIVAMIALAFGLSQKPGVTHADGSQTYSTPGTYTFTVPAYNVLTVQAWGGGGGGNDASLNGVNAQAGTLSSFNGSVTGNGGAGASGSGGSAIGGTASGGTTNTTGGSGGAGITSGVGAAGGTSPNGGTGGAGAGYPPNASGSAGNAPGGGGGGATRVPNKPGGGGGGGGYSTITYSVGQLAEGAAITVVVGSGGSAGCSGGYCGGTGAPGQVTITWTSPPASCTFNSSTVTSGSSVTAYQSSTVPYGSSCVSESRACSNGSLSGSYTYASCSVLPQSSTPITGYLWSDTIGWISMSGTGYGVSIAGDRTISGYAWSDNIGWIKFGGLSSFPAGGGTTAADASLTGSNITGWARACAGTSAGDCSSMTSRSDGWDGWIALSGTNYGPSISGGAFSGYSWGDVNTGWISWSSAATTFQACQATQGYSCVAGNSVHTLADCSQTTDVCASHGAGYFCAADNHLCTAPPPPSAGTNADGSSGVLRAKPSLVKPGATTKIVWTIQNATSCTVSGNGDTWNTTASLAGGNTSSPINQRTTYVLHCVGSGGTLDASTDVTLIPKWQEQ